MSILLFSGRSICPYDYDFVFIVEAIPLGVILKKGHFSVQHYDYELRDIILIDKCYPVEVCRSFFILSVCEEGGRSNSRKGRG
jgi:hypothetical protein